MLDAVLWFIGLAVLWAGAWLDWKHRAVPNHVWRWALYVAVPFLMAEAFTNPLSLALRLAAAVFVGAVAWGLWRGGAMGGADAKAITLAGLLLTPVGYWEPGAARFIPILDALAVCLLVAEIWRRLGRHQSTPFLVPLAPLVTIVFVSGGLLWWPAVWLRMALEAAT